MAELQMLISVVAMALSLAVSLDYRYVCNPGLLIGEEPLLVARLWLIPLPSRLPCFLAG